MSKRHVEELSKVYENIFADATYAFPTLQGEFEKDLTRLRDMTVQRGIRFLTVDLPAVCKHLDGCLANGEYKLSGLPASGRYSNRVVIPKFLRGLYLLVFSPIGQLKEDASYEAIFFIRQILSVGKKADLACSAKETLKEIEEFCSTDRELPEPERFWTDVAPTLEDVGLSYSSWSNSDLYNRRAVEMDQGCQSLNYSALLVMMDKVSSIISTTLGSYDPKEWRFRHGPGAISEVTGPSNKFYWTNWSDRLEAVYPIADCGFHSYPSWAGSVDSRDIGSQDPPSRLVAVPKTFTKPRLIAAEPSEHQWCQQNIWHYFCSRAQKTWISKFVRFTDQTLNQDLCLKGSLDGSLATVDLSAASDRVTCHAVGQMFRSNPRLLLALQASRTRFVELPDKLGKLELKKFSTMGSACTFPIESLIFLSVVISVVLTLRKLKPTRRNIMGLEGQVAVFGDDIIVPEDSRELLFGCLEMFDFKINVNKSYWTGRFRESCGVDAYAGVNVTPAYWRSPNTGTPESVASTISVRNNFYQRLLTHTASYIASSVRQVEVPYVSMDSGVMGFKTRVGPIPPCRKTRWNSSLHRSESLVPMLIASAKKTPTHDDTAILQYFTEDPSPLIKWEHGVSQWPVSLLRYRWVASHELTAQ